MSDFVIKNGVLGEYTGSAEHVVIPDGVVEIAEYVFEEKKTLKSIKLNEGLVMIGTRAFCGCSSLKEIELPDSVRHINDFAFFECDSLESIKLNEGLKTIGDLAFCGCKSLKEIEIPNSVYKDLSCAFMKCDSLKEVVMSMELFDRIKLRFPFSSIDSVANLIDFKIVSYFLDVEDGTKITIREDE